MVFAGRARFGFVALAFACALRAPVSAQLVPATDEFQVNAHSTSSQFEPVAVADPAGNVIVVWSSYEDGDSAGIVARRYDSAGTPLGTEFQVNSYTTGAQYTPNLAVGTDGRFVVTWESYGQDGSERGVFAQRFDSSGTPVGSEFQVNTLTASEQRNPAAAFDGAGNFVVAWDHADDGSYAGIFARRYDSSGVAQGSEFQVNTFTGNDQLNPDIAHAGAGFVIVWSSFAGDGSGGGVFSQRFDDAGVPQGTEFVVNTYTTGGQGDAHVAASADGNFVVVWAGYNNQDGSGFGIFGQRYSSAASPIGSEFQVNAYTAGNQVRPVVAAAAPGNFVVAWQGPGEGESPLEGVWARAFTSDGIPDGGELHLNQYTEHFQNQVSIAATDDRSFVAVWQSQLQDGDLGGIFGRRLTQSGTPVSGRRLFIRTPPSDPSRNTLTLVSTDAGLELPQGVIDDPRCPPVGSGSVTSGARLRVVGDGGNFTLDLPCVNWSANGAGTRYRYRDATGATCRSIVLRAGRLLKASCKGAQVAYALGAPQGNVHVVLSTGDPAANRKYCATFGPLTSATVVRDGSDGRSYAATDASPGVCS